MKKLTDEEFEALKQKHPGRVLERVDAEEVEFCYVFIVPNWTEWSVYQRDLTNAEVRLQVIKREIQLRRVYPSAEELDAFVERYPAMPVNLAGEIGEAAGTAVKITRKK